MFKLDDYNYTLPPDLIAQEPVVNRDQARLFYLNRKNNKFAHHRFSTLYDLLGPDDLLVINNTEVIPGRLLGKKETGGKVELLFLDYAQSRAQSGNYKRLSGIWVCRCLIKASKSPLVSSLLLFDKGLKAEILEAGDGFYTVRFFGYDDFEKLLYQIGKTPLPPYIKRNGSNPQNNKDRFRYQTVYASQKGAIAAPTAGLHFTKDLLARLVQKGIKIAQITLHVGYGTFSPVRVNDIREHKMHSEWYSISQKTAHMINKAKEQKKRIVAVGTTCVRTLEFASDDQGRLVEGSGNCDLFIYPGYDFKVVDAMITNFHLPGSTLLMLISAFAGRQKILKAYDEAVDQEYRFFSYGDAMFIS